MDKFSFCTVYISPGKIMTKGGIINIIATLMIKTKKEINNHLDNQNALKLTLKLEFVFYLF